VPGSSSPKFGGSHNCFSKRRQSRTGLSHSCSVGRRRAYFELMSRVGGHSSGTFCQAVSGPGAI
jgi:hypothetical protein